MRKFRAVQVIEAAPILGMTVDEESDVTFVLDAQDERGCNMLISVPKTDLNGYTPRKGDYLMRDPVGEWQIVQGWMIKNLYREINDELDSA